MAASRAAAVELYWIPLGAGGHFVRFNGRTRRTTERVAYLNRAAHKAGRDLPVMALVPIVAKDAAATHRAS